MKYELSRRMNNGQPPRHPNPVICARRNRDAQAIPGDIVHFTGNIVSDDSDSSKVPKKTAGVNDKHKKKDRLKVFPLQPIVTEQPIVSVQPIARHRVDEKKDKPRHTYREIEEIDMTGIEMKRRRVVIIEE